MSGVLEAVAASSHGAGPRFLAALAAQAQDRLEAAAGSGSGSGSGGLSLAECARLACGMASVGAAPSPAWLSSLQRATVGSLRPTAAQSSPPPARTLADLALAVAQLAANTIATRLPGPVPPPPRDLLLSGLLNPDWVSSLVWCIDSRVTSPKGDPFQPADLARVLWATAAIGSRPRREVVNSFVGKSQVGAASVRHHGKRRRRTLLRTHPLAHRIDTIAPLPPAPCCPLPISLLLVSMSPGLSPSRTASPPSTQVWSCSPSGRCRGSTPL